MRHDVSTIPDSVEVPAGRSRLLARLYRDIGLAAVAEELAMTAEQLGPELSSSVARGARYLAPKTPKLALAS